MITITPGVSGGEAVYKTDVFTSADALDISEATAPPVKRTRLKTGSRKGKLVKF